MIGVIIASADDGRGRGRIASVGSVEDMQIVILLTLLRSVGDIITILILVLLALLISDLLC